MFPSNHPHTFVRNRGSFLSVARAGILVVAGALLVAFALPSAPSAPPAPPASSASAGGAPSSGEVAHVIHISVDGLRPDAVTRLGPDRLPNFYRLRTEGAFTDNARTDVDYGNTLPNHMAQLTGRPVLGDNGHNWRTNKDPLPGETLHSRRGAYLPSVFDVVHDNGMSTAAYASKSKFVLLERSYGAEHGAPDVTGDDDGRNKIDAFVYRSDTRELVNQFVWDMQVEPKNYAFLHLRDPDTQGHRWGWRLWSWHPYMQAVRHVDRLLGEVFRMVDEHPAYAGRTVVILTADHGGSGHTHGAVSAHDYTVPFYVWGAGIPAADLYALNLDTLEDPGAANPAFQAARQPIRNGSVANLSLALLGLEAVPGSSIAAANVVAPSHLVEHAGADASSAAAGAH